MFKPAPGFGWQAVYHLAWESDAPGAFGLANQSSQVPSPARSWSDSSKSPVSLQICANGSRPRVSVQSES